MHLITSETILVSTSMSMLGINVCVRFHGLVHVHAHAQLHVYVQANVPVHVHIYMF
jgi:hypothetical protein